jgi:hypothetical protein
MYDELVDAVGAVGDYGGRRNIHMVTNSPAAENLAHIGAIISTPLHEGGEGRVWVEGEGMRRGRVSAIM